MQKRKGEHGTLGDIALEMYKPVTNNEMSDPKKVRLESGISAANQTPSKVIHLRRLPLDVTENEVASMAIPFGSISNMVLTKKTGMALIELVSQEAATAMVQYYSGVCPPTIRGTSPIAVQYSKYDALSTPGASQHISEAILAVNKQITANAMEAASGVAQRVVIRVQVDRAPPNISLNYLMFYKVFHNFGRIVRIIVFKSAQIPQALIEFDNPLPSHVAKLQMNSVPLFPSGGSLGNGIMRTDWSKQTHLEVRRENDSCRDFVANPLTDQELASLQMLAVGPGHLGVSGAIGSVDSSSILNGTVVAKAAQYLNSTAGAGTLLDKHGNVDPVALAAIAGRVIQPLLAAAAGRGTVDAGLIQQQLAALQQLAPHAGIEGIAGIDVPHHYHQSQTATAMSTTASILAAGSAIGPGSGLLPPNVSPVVIASGLDVEKVTPDILFILFGVYGDVQRVKIMYNKKDTALIQYTDASQAAAAVQNLNGVSLYGNVIRCNFSKHFHIKMPATDQQRQPDDDSANISMDGLHDSNHADTGSTTRDYSNHRLHRFKRANSRNHQNIYPPSPVLHVSNLPESATEADLIHAFSMVSGQTVVKCKMMANEKRMALVQFESIEKAIAALVDMHDYPLTENCRIRISFSKSLIRN